MLIVFFIGLIVFPFWAIKDMSVATGITATVGVGMAAMMLSAIVAAEPAEEKKKRRLGPYDKKYQKRLAFVLLVFWGIAELIAVAATHFGETSRFYGPFGSVVAEIGSFLVPSIAKLSTTGFSQAVIFEAQVIFSAFMLAGLASVPVCLTYIFLKPEDELRQGKELALQRYGERSPVFFLFGIPFLLLLSLASYFGWGEFDPLWHERFGSEKHCLLEAYCYLQRGHSILFMAALMKGFGVVFFPTAIVGSIAVSINTMRRNEKGPSR